MSYKTGGEIEKGGNQYESLAIIYYFAKLLNDEIIYVQSESFDADFEKGTDIVIKDKSNKIFVVQAKSRDGLEDVWDLAKLKKHSIIKNACHHISSGRDFHLLSPLDFTALKDFCSQSRGYTDFESFEKFIIGNNHKSNNALLFEKIVKEIKNYFANVSPINFFHHFYIDILPDNSQLIQDLLAGYGKVNQPKKAFSSLDHYITKHNKLNQQIYVSEIRNYLKAEGITFFNIDTQAASLTLNDLQEKFINNLKRKLINKKWLERKEFEDLVNLLNHQKVAIISGQSGTGKSALVYKLCNKFKSENKVFLPLSFEVNIPTNNLFEYGKSLGFTASPTEILRQLSNGETCYLIIDQVDAIKWEQNDWNSAFDACCSLVKTCEQISNLKIIFACRTIDADRILNFWESSAPKLSDCQICLSELNTDSIRAVINHDNYQNLTPSIKELLRNARNLKMYTDICATKNYIPSNNIIHDYIEIKQKEIRGKGFSSKEITEFLNYIISELRQTNTNAIPLYKVEDKFSKDLFHAYCSAGVIELTPNNLIKFTHQSILDYYLVKDLVCALDNGMRITNIISRFNHHPLSDLEIIKQFLESCYDREQYIDYLNQIIFSNRIRMIIKNIAIRALKTIKNSDKTNALYLKILRSKYYGLKYLYFFSSSNQYFSSYFIKQKEFTELLNSNNYEDKVRAIELLLQANNSNSIKILTAYLENISDDNIIRLVIHNIDDINASDELFSLKISLLKKNTYKSYYIDWKKIITGKNERLAQYLSLFLTDDCFDKDFIYEIESSVEIVTAVETDFNGFYKLSKKKIETEFDFELTYDIISQYDHDKRLTAFIFETSLAFLSNDEIISLAQSDKCYFKHAALRAVLNCEFNKGLKIFSILVDKEVFPKQNYFHDRQLLEIVCALITKFSNNLPENNFKILENQINNYKSPSLVEFAKERFAQRKSGYFYHYCEEEQKRFLDCLPHDKLTELSKNYLLYLRRKFPQNAYYTWKPEMDQVTGYTVVSCIAEKWHFFSSVTWHQIMSNPKTGQKDRGKMVVNDRGQAIEATLFEFCSTINTAARSKPKTFVELALNYNDLRQPFVEAICEGLYANSQDDKQTLEQCAPEQKLLVYKKYFDIRNKKILLAFVRFVERNNIVDSWVYEKLLEIANNPDKYENNIMNTWSSNWNHKLDTLTVRDIETEKINRVQTCAINCLSNTLFDKTVLPKDIKSILLKCLDSPHPVVLLSSIDILFPIWNFDKDFVVKNILEVYEKDIRTIASIKSIKLLRYLINYHHENLYNIFAKVINTNNKEFEHVYRTIISAFCHFGYYKNLLKQLVQNFNNLCFHTCTQILNNTTDIDILDRTRDLIISLQEIKQEEKNKRINPNSIIDSKLISDPKNHPMILKAIRSKTFFADTYSEFKFVHELQEISKLLPISKIILTYCKSFLKFKNHYSFDIDKLISIIIKLYLESYEAKKYMLSHKCLKILDKIYSNYIVNHDLVDLIDI